jgi:SAM-dependent methyltransferase
MEQYWNERYAKEGKIWGDKPSATATYAKDLFLEHNVKKILIPGFGYGRNARVFEAEGFNVTGVEISETAIAMAQKDGLKFKTVLSSILDYGSGETFDAVYCYNLLHYFLINDRK